MRKFTFLVVAVFSLNVATAFANNSEWFAAVSSGDLKAVESLINSGADLEAVNNSGWTALLYASCVRDSEMVELLIASGADVNAVNDSESVAGQSVYMVASSLGGEIEVLPAVSTAYYEEEPSVFSDVGGHFESAEEHYELAVLTSSERISTSTTELLLTASADVHAIYDDGLFEGESALMHASWEGDIKTAELLIKAGADINAVDKNGATSLDYAKRSLEAHTNQLSEGSERLGNLEKVIAFLNANGAESGKQDVN